MVCLGTKTLHMHVKAFRGPVTAKGAVNFDAIPFANEKTRGCREARFLLKKGGRRGCFSPTAYKQQFPNSPIPVSTTNAADQHQDQGEDLFLPDISAKNFWTAVRTESQEKRLVVVVCYTSTCIPCRTVKPQIVELSRFYRNGDKVSFYQFELVQQNKDVALQLGVQSSPTFLVFKNGMKFEVFRGSSTLPSLKKFLHANYS